MEELNERRIPGTVLLQVGADTKAFSQIELLISATGGLSLSQVCAITGLEGSTIQNWVKRGWVANPRGKKYSEVHIARILIINALKDCIRLESIARLMHYVNGATEDTSDDIIKENVLFDYLCDALHIVQQADDLSPVGVEAVVKRMIEQHEDTSEETRSRLCRSLAVMIYACVCSDVKRRTEAMLAEIIPDAPVA